MTLAEFQPHVEAAVTALEWNLARARTRDVTADQVSVHPLRSVPMDMITAAVVRQILRLPVELPILRIKTLPSEDVIYGAVCDIASRWQTPLMDAGSSSE